MSLRSGTAYRLSHLHHHAHLLKSDDLEGSAAYGTLPGAITNGMTLQIRLWLWAWNKHRLMRWRLLTEAIIIVLIILGAVFTARWSLAPLIYIALVVGGSWLIPLITVYIPHYSEGRTPLTQTRRFRGRLIQLITWNHYYHLEHHLYPAIPHHHWKSLADRLDPYLDCQSSIVESLR